MQYGEGSGAGEGSECSPGSKLDQFTESPNQKHNWNIETIGTWQNQLGGYRAWIPDLKDTRWEMVQNHVKKHANIISRV